jgi:uncharacterized protein
MVNSALVGAFAALFGAGFVPLAAQETPAAPAGPVIVVAGRGERTVAPDLATVIIAVSTTGKTPSLAGALNAERNNAVRDAIGALGVARQQMSTEGYVMNPYMTERRDTGYVAENTVRVELRRLDLVGRVIDTALAAGATRIAGVQFTASHTSAQSDSALADAVQAAHRQAAIMAKAGGGRLGDLIALTTERERGDWQLFGMQGGVAGAGGTTIVSHNIPVTADVLGKWRFVKEEH